ncbi:MAG: LPS export ABC transporter periplasmic protein LptC [Thermodesulfobacteriota bacterium]
MSKFVRKNWPLVVIGLLILSVLFYVGRPGRDVVRKPITPDASAVGTKLEDIHYTHEGSKDGIRWTLDAKEVRISENREQYAFTTFRLKLEPPDKAAVHLEGNNGHYDKAAGRLTLSGDLKGRTEDGYTFATERAVFSQTEGRLSTEEPVLITGPLLTVEGRGLNYNVATETLEIGSAVTTLISREKLTS